MKLKRKKTFVFLFVLMVLIGLMFFSGAIIEIFDIELSKPARVYYEPDENK